MSQIDYHQSGCSGVLVTQERTNSLSPLGMALVAAFLLWNVLAVCYSIAAVPFVWILFGVILFGEQRRSSLQPPSREGRSVGWIFAVGPVARRFSVEGGVLTLPDDDLVIPLRGAEIRGSAEGVCVVPALGEPVELFWEEADIQSAEVLAEAMRGVVRQLAQQGTAAEIPEALQAVREPESQSPG